MLLHVQPKLLQNLRMHVDSANEQTQNLDSSKSHEHKKSGPKLSHQSPSFIW